MLDPSLGMKKNESISPEAKVPKTNYELSYDVVMLSSLHYQRSFLLWLINNKQNNKHARHFPQTRPILGLRKFGL